MKTNFFRSLLDIKKEEWPFSILMAVYFFLITTSFWILKPIKKSLFIDYYKVHEGITLIKWHLRGSQAELIAKILNMLVAAGAVAAFTLLARRFIRQQLTIIFSFFFIASYLIYIPLMPVVNQHLFAITASFRHNLNKGNRLSDDLLKSFNINHALISKNASVSVINRNTMWRISDKDNRRIYTVKRPEKGSMLDVYLTQSKKDLNIWTFYLFGDLFITLMLVTFFAFLNDSVTAECAKRLYGLIGFGGVAGGAFGALSVRTMIHEFTNIQWLLILTVIAIIVILTAILAGKKADKTLKKENYNNKPHKATLSAAMEGARLTIASRYLLAIVGIVGLYEMVSTIMDFQFTATVEHFIQGSTKEHFSLVFTITNLTAMFVQLFLTSLVMTRLGIGAALLILPLAAFAGSTSYLIAPVLFIGSALNTIDNGFNYSINQSAKESLYVPISIDEKYKAKAFIDMFVQRFAKAIAVGLSLIITTVFAEYNSIRWLSLVTISILIIWVSAAQYAGKRFKIKTN